MAEDPSSGETTLAHRSFAITMPEASFELCVVQGRDASARWTIDGHEPGRVLVGSGPAAHIKLNDRTVSRRHLALNVENDRLRATDLGSRNGSFVNGTAMLDGYLVGGETLRLGDTELLVERRAAAPLANLSDATSFGQVIGLSTEMRRLYPLCERLAQTDIPVVIEGETGTGKEVLAESLHQQGPRAASAFVVFDCTAVPAQLVEAELFGHEKGAFTSAHAARDGLFGEAHGGTLLIDEIADLELPVQAKLLRAIDRSEFRKVGSNQWQRADVRVLAATRRDLDREVQEGRFRDDLFHRIAVGRIELPPLRTRQGDVRTLVRHFCEQTGTALSAIPEIVMQQWENDPWPGNVRELRNHVARFLALGDLDMWQGRAPQGDSSDIQSDALPMATWVKNLAESQLSFRDARERVLAKFTRFFLDAALELNDQNVTHAAEASGLARRYFQILRAKHLPSR